MAAPSEIRLNPRSDTTPEYLSEEPTMAFIDTISPARAEGEVRDMYARQQAKYGYVPNYARVFCHRPELMQLWAALLAGIRRHIEPRRFELVTFAAAHALGNSYCSLAHGDVLKRYLRSDDILALARGAGETAVSEAEAAMMAFARQVARDATAITAEDVERLRQHGFSDAEIFDIAATAAARAFLAKLSDALGARADARFLQMEAPLRDALTVGRPIAEQPPERVA
jgi:uncharacterized peroxidase-related enzyme